MEARNPDFVDRIKKYLKRQNFMHHINFSLDHITAGKTSGRLVVEDIHRQQKGLVHGGVIATLADIVAGFAAYTLVAEDQNVVTGEIKISFLRPAKGSELLAKGYVIKSGKKINFCEAEVWSIEHDKEIMVAKASTSMITI